MGAANPLHKTYPKLPTNGHPWNLLPASSWWCRHSTSPQALPHLTGGYLQINGGVEIPLNFQPAVVAPKNPLR